MTFKSGDQVLLSTDHLKLIGSDTRTPKFSMKYLGPFKILRSVNDNAYELDLSPQMLIHPVLNISRLKAYKDPRAAFPSRPQPNPRPPVDRVLEDGGAVFTVERILAKRGTGARARYLVKWSGYPLWESTWEPANLKNARDALAEYHTRVVEDHDAF